MAQTRNNESGRAICVKIRYSIQLYWYYSEFTLSTAISTTDKTLKKVDINHNISKLQEELRQVYEEFGRGAHQQATVAQEALDIFLNRCQMIGESIGQLQERLKQIDQGDDPPAETQMEPCAQCGAENNPDSKFCGSCGARLRDES